MDKAHRETDKILADIIEKMTPIFEKVNSKVIERLKKYLQKFESQIAEHEKMVDDGEMTEAEFNRWFVSTVTTGKEWDKVRDDIAEDYHTATEDAMKLAGLGLASIYLSNQSYTEQMIASEISRMFGKHVHFAKKKKKRLLPKSPDPVKNRRWHRRKIESVIRSELKKGHSIDKIAKKLNRVTNMDRVSAYRAARTGATSAENMARIDSMIRAQDEFGIQYDKIWVAVLDNRTRTSHRVINGERVPCEQMFSNGLMFPGDEAGDPAEVYNCRCTLYWAPNGMEVDVEEGPDGMGKLEWSAQKPVSKPYPKWRNRQ